MILADKIIRLRKQMGWSQEELAAKLDVSRQSISKWESANSIPDLNRIITLAALFNVSTDVLFKDEHDLETLVKSPASDDVQQVNLEQAQQYVADKMAATSLIIKGVLLCVCAAVPLFFFMAMAETARFGMTEELAPVLGITGIVLLVSLGVSYFIKTGQYQANIDKFEKQDFELAYGVHSVFAEKMAALKPHYHRKVAIGTFLFIASFLPLMFANVFTSQSDIILLMLVVLFFIISAGLAIVIPITAKHDAYNTILDDEKPKSEKTRRAKRAEKLAAFYWPLLVAIFLGWSLWTNAWGETWIIWPVGAVLYVALLGLMELFEKDENAQ